MKKLLLIIVVSLLLSANAYAHIFKSSNTVFFENCHSNEFSSMQEANVFEAYSFEIDKGGQSVIRTTIWNEKSMKEYEKEDPRKISQGKFKLKAIGDRFISTDFPRGNFSMEFVFDLKNKTIQTSLRTKADIHQYTMQCYEARSR